MYGRTVATEVQAALDTLPYGVKPIIQSDNGSCFIRWDFAAVLKASNVGHHWIYSHWLELKGMIEQVNRIIGEELEGYTYDNHGSTQDVITGIINWYNYKRVHSAIDFVTPADKHHGCAEQIIKERQRKLDQARACRRSVLRPSNDNNYETFFSESIPHAREPVKDKGLPPKAELLPS